ncbi:hypothetical protein NGM37_29640, partial [Streptomyces sp. TRM76130]|nr:hypothetical protein [Streptomyces sp. TRM76130]
MWHTARVLEQRLRVPPPERRRGPVETALATYRNADGGHGHALEPALRDPGSRVPHTGYALRLLDAVGGRRNGPLIEHTCRYLASLSTPDGALPGALTATGPVVAPLHRNGVWHAWLFRATEFCWLWAESPRGRDP